MKKLWLGLCIFVGIILIISAVVYFSYFATGPLAILIIDSGTVQYRINGEWSTASNGMTLKQGYSIKTLSDSFAKIILSDSVMRMDANTEISLDELNKDSISLSQTAGKTWSKILKISGISNYEISTPDAIATVRGTAFAVETGNSTRIRVVNGTVNAKIRGKDIEKDINANKETRISNDSNSIDDTDLMLDEWIKSNIQKDEQYKQELKEKLMKKYNFLINIAKQQNSNLTDSQINTLIDEWLDGKHSVRKAIEDGTIPGSIAGMIPPALKRY